MKCPRDYSENIPRACASHCPILRGEPSPERFYSVNEAANNPHSPLFGVLNVQAINQAVWRGGLLRTDKGQRNTPSHGRDIDKLIPHCALVAYRENERRGVLTNERNEAGHARIKFALDILRGVPTRKQIIEILKDETAYVTAAQARGEHYARRTYADIARQFDVTRERVRQIAKEEGLE